MITNSRVGGEQRIISFSDHVLNSFPKVDSTWYPYTRLHFEQRTLCGPSLEILKLPPMGHTSLRFKAWSPKTFLFLASRSNHIVGSKKQPWLNTKEESKDQIVWFTWQVGDQSIQRRLSGKKFSVARLLKPPERTTEGGPTSPTFLGNSDQPL